MKTVLLVLAKEIRRLRAALAAETKRADGLQAANVSLVAELQRERSRR
jgi:hypothetical protein